MVLEFLIAYPISLVLDWTLGKEHGVSQSLPAPTCKALCCRLLTCLNFNG